mgnify:CR=1 FL=1
MNQIKSSLIRLALENQVLSFGEFILKSGRISPYFFNAGLFYTGQALRELGSIYAQTLIESSISFDHLFGPAYKGLPLATTTAIALAQLGVNTTLTFNRKEVKNHGEGGTLIGAPLYGNTVIIDDVITAGTAFREAHQLIQKHGGQTKAVLIMLDRCEKGQHEVSTLTEIRNQGIEVCSIISIYDLIEYLYENKQQDIIKKIELYLDCYGVD